MRHDIAFALALATLLGGCVSQVRTTSGATGAALPPGSAVTLIGASQAGGPLARQAQDGVVAALARRGHALAAEAAARLEIGLTDRPATTGVGIIDGAALSPASGRKFLQSCHDRTYRLTLTYYGAGEAAPVTRAWAEERHCKGTIEDSIPSLAETAVAALAAGPSRETRKRRAIE